MHVYGKNEAIEPHTNANGVCLFRNNILGIGTVCSGNSGSTRAFTASVRAKYTRRYALIEDSAPLIKMGAGNFIDAIQAYGGEANDFLNHLAMADHSSQLAFERSPK